jgi:hypothetical protein
VANDQISQAGFVKAFFLLTSGLQRVMVVWAFAYQQTAAPFNSMGLPDANGTLKQAWDAWLGGE